MKLKSVITAAITVGSICFTPFVYADSYKSMSVSAYTSGPVNISTYTVDYNNIDDNPNASSTWVEHNSSIQNPSGAEYGFYWYANAHAYAYSRDEIGNLGSTVGVDGSAFEGHYADAESEVIVGFDDFVTVTSGDLPLGTPVQIELSHALSYETEELAFLGNSASLVMYEYNTRSEWTVSSSDGDYLQALHLGEIILPLEIDDDLFSLSDTINDSFIVDTFVGETISISDRLATHLYGHAQVGDNGDDWVDSAFFYSRIDLSHSAHTYMTALTPGVNLISDSGHDYSFPTLVPEPETYAMLLAGLGLLGFMARRRKESAA